MAEAEDVIVDAARHATAYAQAVLSRRRAATGTLAPTLLDLAPRLDLLLAALHGRNWPLRAAQAPAPATALSRLLHPHLRPRRRHAVPSSDGSAIWLPRTLEGVNASEALVLYRAMALHQAQRATLRHPAALERLGTALQRAVYLVFEAQAAEAMLRRALPGMSDALRHLRSEALRRRPALDRFSPARRALEQWLRHCLAADAPHDPPRSCADAVECARAFAPRAEAKLGDEPLFKDWWTGDWAPHDASASERDMRSDEPAGDDEHRPVRSARLARRPEVREAEENEDDAQPGVWMVQGAQPHESAEDPMGMQRPTDRDVDGAAEAHAESVSDLAQARLVRTPQRAHEVLLSDEPPPPGARHGIGTPQAPGTGIAYPEWDWRAQAYRDPGTTVWPSVAEAGDAQWVERTLESQRGVLAAIRRRFEMLRAQRVTLHRQEDGDDLDIEACIEARTDVRAGASPSQRLYRTTRLARRDAAVLVLVDVSGSTDAWVGGQRRIIDVEREALLLLSIALDGTGDPHAILAFSGKGPQQVTVRSVKRFDERHDEAVARRISGLEPEHYTRAGAALRHASRLLAAQPARHQLLMLLSDGKPNDEDEYEGRYGVEDMRQAVIEARNAGQSPFCLTVDRQAATYLPRVFGPHHCALLQHPARLPTVLLEWMKRLLTQ